jgi:hypothetical protein
MKSSAGLMCCVPQGCPYPDILKYENRLQRFLPQTIILKLFLYFPLFIETPRAEFIDTICHPQNTSRLNHVTSLLRYGHII